jgi:hypothetical protein
MRVYKIEYLEYEYRLSDRCGDYFLAHIKEKHVMADNPLEAVDLLRSGLRRIEIASIEHICKVDIKK